MTQPAPYRAFSDRGRLIVASNRLPIVLEREEGGWRVEPGSGGLVTAMEPVLQDREGEWVGWPGVVDVDVEGLEGPLARLSEDRGYRLIPVKLTSDERDRYYYGFSNEVLWPLLHELQTRYRYDPAYWDAYRAVNRKFATVLHREADPEDFVWVHDYHLMAVANWLRRLGREGPVGYFLHTPFPTRDLFLKLPWREAILDGLLAYDLLGFQTVLDRDNFLATVAALHPEAEIQGQGSVVECRLGDRTVRVGAFPISIDFREFEEIARSEEVERKLRELRSRFDGRSIVLGVDRLDYTKGIRHQFEAFRTLLQTHPELRGDVSLVQIVVPSREGIPQYSNLKTQIERMVGEINGQFSQDGWVPIHYYYRSLDRANLVAYYRRADVGLVTPLKDGMNLVAKEYCASHVDGEGVLVLSEFAGAAAQLQEGALLVNPFGVTETAEILHRALTLPPEQRRERMEKLRATVREQDIFWWVDAFLDAAGEPLGSFPEFPHYVPGAPRQH